MVSYVFSLPLSPVPPARPRCAAFYNLFYGLDVLASRLEPLLDNRFAEVPPVPIPSYRHYPRGGQHRNSLKETVAKHPYLFGNHSLVVPRHKGDLCRKKSSSTESIPTSSPSHWGTTRSKSIHGNVQTCTQKEKERGAHILSLYHSTHIPTHNAIIIVCYILHAHLLCTS